MEEFLTFNATWPWPWPWIKVYGIPSCITHRPLHTNKFHWDRTKNLLKVSQLSFLPSSNFKVAWHKNWERYQKSGRNKFRYCPLVKESAVICQLPWKIAEIDFENGRISNFQRHVTLDQATRHTIMHHPSTSTYTPNFIRIGKTFCGQTDGRTYIEVGFIRSTRSWPYN